MENNIVTLENKRANLNKLKAAHNLYSEIGLYTGLYIVFCVIVPIVLSFARFLLTIDEFWIQIMTVYGIISCLSGFYLERTICKRRDLAVRIQQLFDSDVLGLSWNKIFYGEKPSQEEINDNIGSISDSQFINWYDEKIRGVKEPISIILCQRINLSYDIALRKKFFEYSKYTAFVGVALILSFSLFRNEGVRDIIIFIVVPLIPLIRWIYVTSKQNMETISKCESCVKIIDYIFEHIHEIGKIDSEDLHRIQDCIFLHRKTAFKIPDWFYKIKRNKLEVKNYHTINSLIEQYRLLV